MGKPKVLILGNARHGKDTVAELLRDHHGYSFVSSSLACADIVMMPYFASIGRPYASVEDCFNDRHSGNHRAVWHEQIKAYNAEDPTRLTREIIALNDMYVGMRSNREYLATRHLYDLIAWVDATGRGIPPEDRSSMDIEYDPEWMRMVRNDGDLEDLKVEVISLAAELRTIGWGKYMAQC